MRVNCKCGVVFFFQAEDGIRDAQESRGLGDVYKRQLLSRLTRVEEKWLSHEETEQMYLAKIAELEENNRKTLAKIEEQYRNDIENQKERYETTLKVDILPALKDGDSWIVAEHYATAQAGSCFLEKS